MKLWSVVVASYFYTDEVGVANKVFLLNLYQHLGLMTNISASVEKIRSSRLSDALKLSLKQKNYTRECIYNHLQRRSLQRFGYLWEVLKGP